MEGRFDKEVYVDYEESFNRWFIFDSQGKLITGYANEADAMFDYAALRNGEVTVEYVQNRGIEVGDRVKSAFGSCGTVIKAEKGVIHCKMDYQKGTGSSMFSSASSFTKI